MRQTVGGAQSVFTSCSRSTWTARFAEKRGASWTRMVAPAFHGAKKLDHACFAQPGELMFQWRSPGRRPV
jgi:hypothetical protein